MYLHLGNDIVIRTDNIVGIFDLDNCTVSKLARDFINGKEKQKKIISVSFDLPKSFIIYKDGDEEIIYICQFTSSVLLKRILLGGELSF